MGMIYRNYNHILQFFCTFQMTGIFKEHYGTQKYQEIVKKIRIIKEMFTKILGTTLYFIIDD